MIEPGQPLTLEFADGSVGATAGKTARPPDAPKTEAKPAAKRPGGEKIKQGTLFDE
jgi:hypothetical protein